MATRLTGESAEFNANYVPDHGAGKGVILSGQVEAKERNLST